MKDNKDDEALHRLLDVMRTLRDPDNGCPWDIEQTFASIAPYTIEEAYEVADAIARGSMEELCDELGDLLLQVVFHARMAEEGGAFDFHDVASGIAEKMVRRHPHVFGSLNGVDDPSDTIAVWEDLKAKERAIKQRDSILDDIALALPALMRAEKLQKRAARVGFDWPDAARVLSKIKEETEELTEAAHGKDQAAIVEEYGDLLFAMVNLGRHLKLDPEDALRGANAKFDRRFRYIEQCLRDEGRTAEEATLEQMEIYWQAAKSQAPARG